MPENDVTIKVIFEEDEAYPAYKLEIISDGNGTIGSRIAKTYQYADTKVWIEESQLIPNQGKEFKGFEIVSGDVTFEDLTVIMKGQDTVLRAIFEDICPAHTFGEYYICKPATHTETGAKARVCTNCNYVETVEIPANTEAHNYVDGVCNICSAKLVTSEQVTTTTETTKITDVTTTQVSIPKEILTTIETNQNLSLEIKNANLDFSKEVVETIKDKDGELTIHVDVDSEDALTYEQASDMPNMVEGTGVVVNVTATVGDEKIHELGGAVTVKIPYDVSAITEDTKLVVYYVDANGIVEEITDVTVDPEGFISFETDHFSTFVVSLEKIEVNDEYIKQIHVSLGTDIAVNYYVEYAGSEALQMRFTVNGIETVVDAVADGEQYKFRYAGIAPHWIGDTITAELLADGEVIQTKEYSVLQYLNTLKGMSAEDLGYASDKYDAMICLINDLLVYGGAAQTYKDYRTDELVSEGITGTTFQTLTATDAAGDSEGEYVTFNGMTVYFDSVNKLMFRFATDDLTDITFGLKVNDGREIDVDYVKDGDNYIITTDAIYAVGFDDVYTITAYKDGVADAYLSYSVKSYVYSKQDGAGAMADLAKATYNYGLAAKAFKAFGNTGE